MLTVFYRNPRLLALTLAVILVAGFSAYQFLPRLEDPRLTQRAALVTTLYPGAGAERVEALITEKIEEELEEVEEIKLIRSTSRTGISMITVEISDDLPSAEAERVFARIRDKAGDAAVRLPAGALPPVVNTTDTEVDAYTIITSLVWTGGVEDGSRWHDPYDSGVPYSILRRRAEELADRLRTIRGVKQVKIFGAPREEIVAEVDPETLARLNLDAADVARMVGRSDAKEPAGQLRDGRRNLLVEVEGRFESISQVAEAALVTGDGHTLRLRDIARVRKTLADPPDELAAIGGRPGIAVGIRMESGQRIDRWAESVRKVIGEFGAGLPRGIALETLFDQSRYVEDRIGGLEANLSLGVVLVMLVILATMGWRSALLVGSALPLASLMTLGLLQALGVPIHQMSITGMIIALGLLIDNAIVMVDEVNRRLRGGAEPDVAVSSSIRHLAIPLASSTVTTVIAFTPIVLVPGGPGEFIGPIAISVILAVASSLLLALTVVPALAGRFRGDAVSPKARWWRDGWSSAAAGARYERFLAWTLSRPWRAVALSVVVPIIGYSVFPQLQEQFFPPSDRDQFQIQLRLPQQASIEQTLDLARKAREELLKDPEVSEVHWFAGRNAPKFYYNMVAGDEGSPFYAQALVQIRGHHGSLEDIRRIQDRLDVRFPEAQFIARPLEQGPPFDAPVEVHLLGPDLERLRELGDLVRAELAAIPDVLHTRATLVDGRPKLLLETDPAAIRLAGLDNLSVARQMESSLEGSPGGSLIESTEELPVKVRLRRDTRGDLEGIASLDILAPGAGDARFLPVESLGRLRLTAELASIPHRNGLRSNTIQGFIVAGQLPSVVLDRFRERLNQLELPPGYWYEIGGEASERDSAVGHLMGSVSVLGILMIATLVMSFNSFRMAGVIVLVAGLTVGGGFASLWLFDYPFGFVAITGIMGLIGVSINDSIVVLAALREERPQSVEETVRILVEATRHVVSTTLTTVIGFLPLLLDGGGLWPPMVIAISGGVIGGTVLALIFVPAVYRMLTRPETAPAVLRSPAPAVVATALLAFLAAAGTGEEREVFPRDASLARAIGDVTGSR